MFEIICKTSIPKDSLPNNDLSGFLKNALERIGFIDLEIRNDFIEFKNNKRDNILESFQRRYGDGKIYFNPQNDLIEISTKTSIKKDSVNNMLINFSILILFNIVYWIYKSNVEITLYYIILSIELLISPLIRYLFDRWIINNRQKELLKLIIQYIE
jgi:hypothetical protein